MHGFSPLSPLASLGITQRMLAITTHAHLFVTLCEKEIPLSIDWLHVFSPLIGACLRFCTGCVCLVYIFSCFCLRRTARQLLCSHVDMFRNVVCNWLPLRDLELAYNHVDITSIV